MNIRFSTVLVPVMFACIFIFGSARGQEKDKATEKNSIQSLFEGIPADLRTKVRDNPVRCDRVNDWLKDHVNGKGRTIEFQRGVKRVRTYRSADGTYRIELTLDSPKLHVFEDEWRIYLCDHNMPEASVPNQDFHFAGVSTADAEKLVDSKQVNIRGKVQEARLSRVGYQIFGHTIQFSLEDVQVDGKKWTKAPDAKFGGGLGGKGKKGGAEKQ